MRGVRGHGSGTAPTNQPYWLLEVFRPFFTTVRNYLHPVCLLLLIITYGHLYSIEKSTGGWESSRLFGFMEQGQCTGGNSQTTQYSVGDINVLSPNDDSLLPASKGLYAPLVFAVGGSSSSSSREIRVCLSPRGLSMAMEFFHAGPFSFSVQTLGNAFQAHTKNYVVIYYSSWILVGAVICLAIQMFFFYSQSCPMTPDNMVTINRINTGLLVLLVALMVSSSSNFSTVYTADSCTAAYVNGNRDTFCELLGTTPLRVAWVIFPSAPLARSYPSLALFLAIFLALSWCIKPRQHPMGNHYRVAVAAPTSPHDELLDRMVAVLNRRLGTANTGGTELIRNGETIYLVPRGSGSDVVGAGLPREFFVSQEKLWSRNAMISAWKHYAADEIKDMERCCSICLGVLYRRPDDVESDSGPEGASFISELPCRHLFHKRCILEWCVLQKTCPECRNTLS